MDLEDALFYAAQAKEWLRECKSLRGCPAKEAYTCISILYDRIRVLEDEIKRIREYPDEC